MDSLTDYEKFMALYESLGVPFTSTDDFRYEYPGKNITLTVPKNQTNSLVKGYCGFATTLYFDNDGKFICQHIWE